jgi:hypothetical protein
MSMPVSALPFLVALKYPHELDMCYTHRTRDTCV